MLNECVKYTRVWVWTCTSFPCYCDYLELDFVHTAWLPLFTSHRSASKHENILSYSEFRDWKQSTFDEETRRRPNGFNVQCSNTRYRWIIDEPPIAWSRSTMVTNEINHELIERRMVYSACSFFNDMPNIQMTYFAGAMSCRKILELHVPQHTNILAIL